MRFILLFSFGLITFVVAIRSLILSDFAQFTEENPIQKELLQNKQLHADMEKILARNENREPSSLKPLPLSEGYIPTEESDFDPQNLESEIYFHQVRSASPETQEEYISLLRQRLHQELQTLKNLERAHDVEDEKQEIREKIEAKQKFIDELRNDQHGNG